MTFPESRAQEGARKAFAAVMLCLDAGNPVGAEARIWEALVHYAEPVEKERDEAVAAQARTLFHASSGDDALRRFEHELAEAREENTRLREQLDALKSDEWLRLATVDLQYFRIDEDRGEMALEILCKHRLAALEPCDEQRD